MHKHCLSCNECKRDLDASTFYNGFDGEVYCKYCYAVKFGHKQKSSYNPSSIQDVKTIQGEKGDRSTCPRCFGKVFFFIFIFSWNAMTICLYYVRCSKQKEWSRELEIFIEIVSVVLNATRNWIPQLAVKVK